ncbi:hypothetical protein Avbf_18299 [Armadillidium vulgare]|nr:hypothetical protein Avbf_18299 [Armadillidium vulgare]
MSNANTFLSVSDKTAPFMLTVRTENAFVNLTRPGTLETINATEGDNINIECFALGFLYYYNYLTPDEDLAHYEKNLRISIVSIIIILIISFSVVIFLAIKIKKNKNMRNDMLQFELFLFQEGKAAKLNKECTIEEQAELLPYDHSYEEKLKFHDHDKFGKIFEQGIMDTCGILQIWKPFEVHPEAKSKFINQIDPVTSNIDLGRKSPFPNDPLSPKSLGCSIGYGKTSKLNPEAYLESHREGFHENRSVNGGTPLQPPLMQD